MNFIHLTRYAEELKVSQHIISGSLNENNVELSTNKIVMSQCMESLW